MGLGCNAFERLPSHDQLDFAAGRVNRRTGKKKTKRKEMGQNTDFDYQFPGNSNVRFFRV
jgi:hypothetical protein